MLEQVSYPDVCFQYFGQYLRLAAPYEHLSPPWSLLLAVPLERGHLLCSGRLCVEFILQLTYIRTRLYFTALLTAHARLSHSLKQTATARNNTLHLDVVIPKPQAAQAVRRGSSTERRRVLHSFRLNLWALTGV